MENDCLYVSIYGILKKQLVTKLLLEMYVQELHNIIVNPLELGSLKESGDTENNIIISD